MKELVHLIEKISKRMLKRNRGVAFSPSLPSNTIKSIVSDYNTIKTQYRVNMYKNMNLLTKGKITVDEYIAMQKQEISTAFIGAYTLGKRFGTGDLTLKPDGLEMRSLNVLINNELEYMKNFANDIHNGAGVMSYKRRMKMYIDSLNATFNYGRAVYIPENTTIYWTLGITDKHCDDCLVIAASNPYTKKTLPGIPKSGHTRCLANCLCSLVYSNNSSVEEQEYTDLLTNIPEGSTKNVPTKEDYRHLVDIRDSYYYNTYMFDITKDAAYSDEAVNLKDQYDRYISKQEIAFPLFFYKRDAIKELRLFTKNEAFSMIRKSSEVAKKDILSVFLGSKQVYGVVERIDGDKILLKTLEGLIYTISPDKNVIFRGT